MWESQIKKSKKKEWGSYYDNILSIFFMLINDFTCKNKNKKQNKKQNWILAKISATTLLDFENLKFHCKFDNLLISGSYFLLEKGDRLVSEFVVSNSMFQHIS